MGLLPVPLRWIVRRWLTPYRDRTLAAWGA